MNSPLFAVAIIAFHPRKPTYLRAVVVSAHDEYAAKRKALAETKPMAPDHASFQATAVEISPELLAEIK